MNPENKKILTEAYPGWFDERVLQCGDGWFNLLIDLCEALVEVAPPDFQVLQVKEKFAGMRFYNNPYNEAVIRIVNLAEKASFNICEWCGKNGAVQKLMKGSMWLKSFCNECHEKSENF